MAKTLYPKGAERILSGAVSFIADTVTFALVKNSYTYSEAHEFFSDLSAHIVGTPVALANKTVAGGVFDADDVDLGAIAPGSTVAAYILYKNTGVPGTSPLLMFSTEATGFPFATSGGSVLVPWSNGAAKIISLV